MNKKLSDEDLEYWDRLKKTIDFKLYKKSDAVFYIVKRLSFPYKMLYVFSFFPNFIKDFIYDRIAKYRYKIFGKKISCEIPNDKKRELFIL